MRVCVLGLWHLGSVTAAALASLGHRVTGLDENPDVVAGLAAADPPLFEPGLSELLRSGLDSGKLEFTTDPSRALQDADILWVTFDTPLDDADRADVRHVTSRVERIFQYLREGTVALISSQLPVGAVAALEKNFRKKYPGCRVEFACSPENLVLGHAIDAFLRPARIVLGVHPISQGPGPSAAREKLAELLSPIGAPITWMSIPSAEMTKHALNAFLATSVVFANEIAGICENTGADAAEVETALRSDPRVGPKAYVKPGGAFAGGTLARDIGFLSALARKNRVAIPMLRGVLTSNASHRLWPARRLQDRFKNMRGRRVAILGLTYKPGTDTLRRSEAIRLLKWLIARKARVSAFDPKIRSLPSPLSNRARLAPSLENALQGAEAAVVMTEWQDFKALTAEQVLSSMASPLILDPNRFLHRTLSGDARIRYISVGRAEKNMKTGKNRA
ncbi:MAG: UDP-glucose/GDP-mannose dehydrogenase family protein [Elusimicrobia bacterium]|nr:UDP-glucose/GDP-mannose dehydrogenase family protein [Elusimicrobiota bacterium]